jgi:alpha-galactosidase/6-phospho-beta-glucosidase family protein
MKEKRSDCELGSDSEAEGEDEYQRMQEFKKLKEYIYEQNKKLLFKNIDDLENGKHQLFSYYTSLFEAERDVLIKEAEILRKHLIECSKKQLQDTIKEIEKEFEVETKSAKAEIMASLLEKKKKIRRGKTVPRNLYGRW